jgi:rhodanese-related sulfurtransferase
MSPKSAGQAVKAGYKNVKIFMAGDVAWMKAGYPTYANYGWVCRGNNVIIDLRSAEKNKEARIPRSISMPFARFSETFSQIPIKAPVVLYSDDDAETLAALKILRENGYKKVALVEGNFLGWKRAGGTLISGPVETKPLWTRNIEEGEVSRADFEAALKDPKKAIILDVRTRDERAAGGYPKSQHVPLDELCKEMDNFVCKIKDLDKKKKVYIHCSTGARATMAYKEMNKRGYNVFYLNAEVECEGNKCVIKE